VSLAVLVMAKAPRPGLVKTRLEPLLGPEGCAALQGELIASASRWAAKVAPGSAYLAYGPDGAREDELRPHVAQGVQAFPDGEGDLGDRLAFATQTVLATEPGPLLVVGTDMPLLNPTHGREAEHALARCDLCFGPAPDGGYWLVGMSRPCPEIFALGDAWGGPEVLTRSLDLARRKGLTTALIRPERDLDDAEDARALLAEPSLPADIAALLAASAA